MEFDLHAGEVVLAENQPLAVRHARGAVIVCTRGLVWITVAGEADDIFLHTGQSYRIASNGLVLCEAIGQAAIRVETQARASRWLRPLIPGRTGQEHPLGRGLGTA